MFEAFFRHTITPLAFLDRSFNFIRVNQAYAKVDGKTPEDFVGRNPFTFFPDPQMQEIFQQVVRTGRPYRASNSPLAYPDGSSHMRYWIWQLTPLLDDAGNRVRPLASETGYWRPRPDNAIEVVLAHPTGYAEVWVGSQEVTSIVDARILGARATLRTDVVARTESAKDYSSGERLYGLVDGALLWTFDMVAVGHPMGNHLAARLLPVGAGES